MEKKQGGFTLISLLVIFSVIGFVTLTVLKVFPVYMENMAVSKSLETLENDPQLKRLSAGQIRSLLMKKFDMNAVSGVTGKDIKINRSMSDVSVSIIYETRIDYFLNIDLLLSFSEEFKAPI